MIGFSIINGKTAGMGTIAGLRILADFKSSLSECLTIQTISTTIRHSGDMK